MKTPSKPSLSIVIPVRDMAPQLKLCLQALYRNDLTDSEVFVVDDCSAEDVKDLVIATPAPEGAAFEYVRLERRSGPAGARNEGLRRSRGSHVLFLDADVMLPEHGIEWMRKTIEGFPGRPEIASVMGMYAEQIPWRDFLTDFKNLSVCFLQRTTPAISPFVHTAIFCVRRDVILQAGGFNTRLETAEDFCLGLELGSKGFLSVFDRRIQGIHLKRYSLAGILREDRRRLRDLQSIKLNQDQRRLYYQAQRPSRLLSLTTPGMALGFLALSFLHYGWGLLGILPVLVFLFSNSGILRYCLRLRGLLFAIRSAGFLFCEMIWAELVLAMVATGLLKSGHTLAHGDPQICRPPT